MVSVTVCLDSSQVPACRMSYSDLNISAPVGHTPMQLPQYTHAESGSVGSDSVEIRAPNPRPLTPTANVDMARTMAAMSVGYTHSANTWFTTKGSSNG